MGSILVFLLTLANSLWLLVGWNWALCTCNRQTILTIWWQRYLWMVMIYIVLSDDNTVAVTHEDYSHFWLTIYNFDGSASCHITKKFYLPMSDPTIAVRGDIIVVGIPQADDNYHGVTQVYTKIHGNWAQVQTISLLYMNITWL